MSYKIYVSIEKNTWTQMSVFAVLTLSSLTNDELLWNKLVFCVYVGVSSVEKKTEADSNDVTQCSNDDKPSTGMFADTDDIFSAVCCVYRELASESQWEA